MRSFLRLCRPFQDLRTARNWPQERSRSAMKMDRRRAVISAYWRLAHGRIVADTAAIQRLIMRSIIGPVLRSFSAMTPPPSGRKAVHLWAHHVIGPAAKKRSQGGRETVAFRRLNRCSYGKETGL